MDRADLEKQLLELASSDRDALIAYFLRQLFRREEAHDALQETLTRALEGAERLPADRPLRPWLWGIAAHVRSDFGQARRRRQQRVSGLDADPEGREPSPSSRPEEDERTRRVREALEQLPADQRMAIELNVFGGLTQTEIAESLGWNVARVKNCAKAGHAKLLELLRDVEL